MEGSSREGTGAGAVGKRTREGIGARLRRMRGARTRAELVREVLSVLAVALLGYLLSEKEMLFETRPLALALICASGRYTPAVLLGALAGTLYEGERGAVSAVGYLAVIALRMISRALLEPRAASRGERGVRARSFSDALADVFSENIYLRVSTVAVGAFVVGLLRIILGGFRFYDLFASIFMLALCPSATMLFSPYFAAAERRRAEGAAFSQSPRGALLSDISLLCILVALVYSLEGAVVLGVSLPLFLALTLSLYAARSGLARGLVCSLACGYAVSPALALLVACFTLAYAVISKLSRLCASACAAGVGIAWVAYLGSPIPISEAFVALISAPLIFSAAERINIFEDLGALARPRCERAERGVASFIVAEERLSDRDERLRSISDSFSSLSEVFYNLSTRLKRPSMLDLRRICEDGFDAACARCEQRELCYGAQYASTLEVTKKLTLQLYDSGRAEMKRLPESFKARCGHASEIVDIINRDCAVETKRALRNEKTEIFALDYDAISQILLDAIAENDEEMRVDTPLSRRISKAIAEEGYGEHSVVALGRRRLRIVAEGLDLRGGASGAASLRARLEQVTKRALTEPSFELSEAGVSMRLESERIFSADSAFITVSADGGEICGDTVSVFENRDGYFYTLISDGMGKGRSAALASETCNVFLRKMLSAGNRMDTSIRMLNSVLRAEGGESESECSATVDLLQLDLHTSKIKLIKSGAAPTLVVRRGNVFKLSAACFPIGILRAVDQKQIELDCEDGDIIVMVSDGACVDGDGCDELCKLLSDEDIADEEPRRICERIARAARALGEGSLTDDLSAVVIRVRREVCNW